MDQLVNCGYNTNMVYSYELQKVHLFVFLWINAGRKGLE